MDTEVNTDGIIYIPQYDTYRIKVGKIIVEVLARTLKQTYNIDMVERALKVGSDRLKNDLLDSIMRMGGRIVDDLGNDTNANNADKYRDIYLRSGQDPADPIANNHEQIHSSAWDSLYRQLEPNDPIDALYRGAMDPRDTVVACMDIPEPTPYYDPNAVPKVYFNDRFPSVHARAIIDEAIKLLNNKKNLHLTEVDVERVFEGFKLSIRFDMPFVSYSKKTLIVMIKHAAFDRAHKTDIDMHAGLRAKLDTDTYIKLRIAFLIFEALKIDGCNKPNIDSDLCNVICFS